MAEKLVPTIHTPFTGRDIARLSLVHAPELDKTGVGVLWAQFVTECGDGGKYCYGFNVGNIKHFPGDGYDYHSLQGVWEVVGGRTVVIDAGSPGSWFRAYESLEAGFLAHLRFLQGKRYGSTWPFVLAGKPEDFARELGRCGYFTAPPSHYARAMAAWHARWMVSTAFDEERPTQPSIITPDQLEPEPAIVHPTVPLGTESGQNRVTDPLDDGNS